MRRFIVLTMIAALISVSSLPLLPGPLVCVHAAERLADCDVCYDEMPAMSSMGHTMAEQDVHKKMASSAMMHDKQLSPAAQHCRIECGCGCHASLDGLPHQLAPHALAPASELVPSPVVIEAAALILWTAPFIAALPPPPPKPFPSKLS